VLPARILPYPSLPQNMRQHPFGEEGRGGVSNTPYPSLPLQVALGRGGQGRQLGGGVGEATW